MYNDILLFNTARMHKAIAVLQLILKDFKPSPHDRTLVDSLWLK